MKKKEIIQGLKDRIVVKNVKTVLDYTSNSSGDLIEESITSSVVYNTEFLMTAKRLFEGFFKDDEEEYIVNRLLSQTILNEDKLELFDVKTKGSFSIYYMQNSSEIIDFNKEEIVVIKTSIEISFLNEVVKKLEKKKAKIEKKRITKTSEEVTLEGLLFPYTEGASITVMDSCVSSDDIRFGHNKTNITIEDIEEKLSKNDRLVVPDEDEIFEFCGEDYTLFRVVNKDIDKLKKYNNNGVISLKKEYDYITGLKKSVGISGKDTINLSDIKKLEEIEENFEEVASTLNEIFKPYICSEDK